MAKSDERPENVELLLPLLRQPIRRLVYADTPAEEGVPSGLSVKCDNHFSREFHFILSGHHYFKLGENIHLASPGDVFICDRWQEHGTRPLETPEEVVTTMLHCYEVPWWNSVVNRVGGGVEDLECPYYLFGDVAPFFTTRCETAFEPENAELRSFLLRPLIEVLQGEYLLKLSDKTFCRRPPPTDIVEVLRTYISDRHGANCSLETLSRVFGYSKFHLARQYHARTGETIKSAINRARRSYVKEVRLFGMRQKEIAGILGFASLASYCGWLRKQKLEGRMDEPEEENGTPLTAAERGNAKARPRRRSTR